MTRLIACATLISLPVYAAIYESPITADDEDDLRAAAERGEISDATLQTLVELLEDGVDLNGASRDELYELPSLTYADVDAIVQYRKNEGHIDDPSTLVGAGAITAEQLLQIAPFIIISDEPIKIPVSGRYRLMGAYTVGDTYGPPAFAQLTLRGPFSLKGGIGMNFTRRRATSPTFDPDRYTHCVNPGPCDATGTLMPRPSNVSAPAGEKGTLSVRPEGYGFAVPKFYLQWKSSKFRVLAGTFRIGFAQRLTLDNTTRYTPMGVTPDNVFYVDRELTSNCRLSAGEVITGPGLCPDERYITPDFRWRDAFRGVAFSAEKLELGDTATATFHAFASYQTRSVYQYELFDHRDCFDPRNDNSELCTAPKVYVEPKDGSAQHPSLSYSTLANLWDEIAAGGRAQVSPIPMLEFGLTGYGAVPRWHLPEMQLDFQEYSKYPFGGGFGALGADARVSVGSWNLFLEVARSFDQEPGNGGSWGAVQRSVWGKKKRELELTARLYDVRFINPYARPISTADEVDGQRARDEAGFRIKYTDRSLGDLQLRGQIDYQLVPWDQKGIEGQVLGNAVGGYRAGTMHLDALVRADFKGWDFFEPSAWFEYRNKDLANINVDPMNPAAGRCFTSVDGRRPVEINGIAQLCLGERYRSAVQARFRPVRKKLELLLTYVHDFVSDIPEPDPILHTYPNHYSQDVHFTGEIRSQPINSLLFRLRSRYVYLDVYSKDRGEQSLWSFLEVSWLGFKAFHTTVRYDIVLWLDERNRDRVPNPEHRFRLELEGRF